MNHLITKTNIRNRRYVKVVSDFDALYNLPDNLGEAIAYSPSTLLEDGEWYKITDFSAKDFSISLLTDEFNSANYAQIRTEDYSRVAYLCSFQDNSYCFLQKISSKGIIRKKWFKLSDPSLITDEPILTINSIPDAIYDKNTDILYFKNLSTISSIFKGIDILYREATQEETETFLQNEMIFLYEGFDATKVKTANRKRIAMVMDTFNGMTDENRTNIAGYIHQYCLELNFDETNRYFIISNEKELKRLLYGIEQRYYTTPVTAEKRLANSVITL